MTGYYVSVASLHIPEVFIMDILLRCVFLEA